MTYTLKSTYIACQTCHARIHCDECEARLEEAIMRLCSVHGASVQLAKKEILVDTEKDKNILADALENLGIFVD